MWLYIYSQKKRISRLFIEEDFMRSWLQSKVIDIDLSFSWNENVTKRWV